MDSRYKFVVGDHIVIAISHYAGKTVRGVAKCHPNDTFNIAKGKTLAAARCNEKIAKKRLARAEKKLAESAEVLSEAENRFMDMENYMAESECAYINAQREVDHILEPMLYEN